MDHKWRNTIVLVIPAIGACACVMGGCMQPVNPSAPAAQNQSSPPKLFATAPVDGPPIESNIVRVNKFFGSEPWLNFESDGTRKIDGVRFTVYLESAERPLGVFGTGRMSVTMYRLDRDLAGKETAAQIFEWDLPPEQAYPWRAKQKTALGWGYGLRLHWDPTLDVIGKQVAFVVKYYREDGRVITSSRQVVKVPADSANGILAAGTHDVKQSPAIVRPKPGTRHRAPPRPTASAALSP